MSTTAHPAPASSSVSSTTDPHSNSPSFSQSQSQSQSQPQSHPQPHHQEPPSPSQTQNTNPSVDQARAISAFTASLHSLGANYTSNLVSRSKTLHENSTALSKQEENLAKTTSALHKQNKEWEGIAEGARLGLKELGDLQNWAEVLERELLVRRVRAVDEDGDVDMPTANGNGKVDRRDEEDSKDKVKGKAKAKETEKKGWFSWWW
ncbi:hypothetical protein BDV18DRAFT_41667 [Aspergillus unguis]